MATLLQMYDLLERHEISDLKRRIGAAVIVAATTVGNEAQPAANATDAEKARWAARQQWVRDILVSRAQIDDAARTLLSYAVADGTTADALLAGNAIADAAIQAFVTARVAKIMPIAAV